LARRRKLALLGLEGHDPGLALVGDEPGVVDPEPGHVTGEVAEGLLGAVQPALGVDLDPLAAAPDRRGQARELVGRDRLPAELEQAPPPEALEPGHEGEAVVLGDPVAREQAAALGRLDPALAVSREAARGHDQVRVGVLWRVSCYGE
jgi:hypothetical protein